MTQEHKTKQFIRNAARGLFAQRGYNAVSIKDIAQAVGKQPGGLYNHFSSKQAILVDLMKDNLERAHAAVIEGLDPNLTPEDRLETFVRAHVAFHIANPDDISIAYMELRSLEPEAARTVMPHRDAYEGALRQILDEGRDLGMFTLADPSHHARAILAMLGGVTVWYREDGSKSPDEVAESYVQAALQSVGVSYASEG